MSCSGIINVVSSCTPNWKCNTSIGKEEDGCGNVRPMTSCTNSSIALQMVARLIPMDLRYDLNGNDFVDTGDISLLSAGGALLPYRAATIANCNIPSTVTQRNTVHIKVNVNQGTITENYLLQLRGAISADYSISVSYGIGIETFTITTPILNNVGANNITIGLVGV